MSDTPSRRNVLAVSAGAIAAAAVGAIPAAAATGSGARGSSNPGAKRSSNPLFSADDSVLVLIDYQPEMFAGVNSMDKRLLQLNVRALARSARLMSVPTILTTVAVKMGVNHPTIKALRDEIPDVIEYDRTTMNAWEDDIVRNAITRTGRRNIVFGGLWTEVCLAFPVVHAQKDGYQTLFVADAVGGTTAVTHDMGVQRMVQAGSFPSSWLAINCEWIRDWASSRGHVGHDLGPWYSAELAKLGLGG